MIRAMIIETVESGEAFLRVLAIDISNKNMYLLDMYKDRYTGTIGTVYDFEILYKVQDKLVNERRIMNQRILVKSMKEVKKQGK